MSGGAGSISELAIGTGKVLSVVGASCLGFYNNLGFHQGNRFGGYLTLADFYATTTDGLDEGTRIYISQILRRVVQSQKQFTGLDYTAGTGVFSTAGV